MTGNYSLQDLDLVLRVAENGNMSEVARQLNITNAAVSAAIKRLEASLNVSLFERTTRSVRLSPAGQAFLPHVQQALGALDSAEAELRNMQTLIAGEIRMGLPSDFGRNLMLPWLDAFQQQHPAVTIKLYFSDFMQDLYREGLDVVIRYGEMKDSGLVARKLCSNRRTLVAAPDYLAQHPPLTSLDDLLQHNCIVFYRNDRPYTKWGFHQDDKWVEIDVSGDRSADDGDVVKRWGVAGRGIIYKSRLDVLRELQSGELVEVLQGRYIGQAADIFAVFKERRYQPYRLTALLNYLAQVMA